MAARCAPCDPRQIASAPARVRPLPCASARTSSRSHDPPTPCPPLLPAPLAARRVLRAFRAVCARPVHLARRPHRAPVHSAAGLVRRLARADRVAGAEGRRSFWLHPSAEAVPVRPDSLGRPLEPALDGPVPTPLTPRSHSHSQLLRGRRSPRARLFPLDRAAVRPALHAAHHGHLLLVDPLQHRARREGCAAHAQPRSCETRPPERL